MSQFSRFGTRFTRPTGTLQLMKDLGQANANQNSNICMLGGGNPASISAAESIYQQEMSALIEEDSALFNAMLGKYDGPQGNLGFIRSLVEMLNQRYNWGLTEHNICLTNGSQNSFFSLFNLLAGEMPDGSSKKVLLPLAPEYIGYFDLGLSDHMFTANKPTIQLSDDEYFKYHIDFDTLTIDESIAAICVSRPTNPTGNVLTDKEMQCLDNLAKKNKIPLIVDNAYGFPFPGAIFVDVNPDWHDNIILTMSLSKLGLPGVRTGIVIANESIINGLSAVNAITHLAPNSMGPVIAQRLIETNKLIPLREKVIRPYYRQKSDYATQLAKQIFDKLPIKIHRSEGAFFLWLWCESLPISTTELYQRLVARDVYIIPSEYFFPCKEDNWRHQTECLRVTFTQTNEVLERGFSIIAEEIAHAYAA